VNVGDYFFCEDGLMPEAPNVVEVGCFTNECAKVIMQRWPKARYCCVEPSTTNFIKLLDAAREVPNCHCYRAALASENGLLPFYIYDHEQLHSTFPRHINEGMKLQRTEQVYGARLEKLLDWMRVDVADLILCNAEGAEITAMVQLIESAKLRERVTQFCTSGHFSHVHIYPQSIWDDCVVELQRVGYTVSQRVVVPEIPYWLFQRSITK
jgi:FkbM family methyltransferase